MLPNYDAEAIAEVLGLAFRRGTNDVAYAASKSTVGKNKIRSSRRTTNRDFVTIAMDAAMLIVEPLTTETRDPVKTSGNGNERGLRDSGLSRPSSVLIEKAVEMGLPRTALRHVAEWLAGDDKAKIAPFEWAVVPKTTLERRGTKLSPQESERTERIARLFVHARRALGTAAEAREFMTTPHPELEKRTPIDAAKTDLGTRRTERLLTALEYGLAN